MIGNVIFPGYLHLPKSLANLRMRRYRYGHKGNPMTTAQRHRLKVEWCDDSPYDSRIRGGRVAVITTPVGTKREVVWRAVTRDLRRSRVFYRRAFCEMAKASIGYDQMVSRFDSLGEQAARTVQTINDTLLAKVSRVELYEAMATIHMEVRIAEAIAIAALVLGIVLLVLVVVL